MSSSLSMEVARWAGSVFTVTETGVVQCASVDAYDRERLMQCISLVE